MYLTAHAVKHRGGGRRVGAVVVQARERALKGGPAAGPAMPLSVGEQNTVTEVYRGGVGFSARVA
jgi:hypothetical protein